MAVALERVDVRPLTVDVAEVSWVLVPTNDDLSKIRFHVLRSEGAEGQYVDISGPLVNQYAFLDKGINLKGKFRELGWKVRVKNVQTLVEEDFPKGDPQDAFKLIDQKYDNAARIELEPDFFALEIIRRNNLYFKRFVGVMCAIFQARTLGQRCPTCWDDVLKRATVSNCKDCFGTGFSRGYYSQVNAFLQIDPSPNAIQVAEFGDLEVNQTVMIASNWPRLQPRDLIVERTNRRWRVVNVNTTTRRTHVIRQFLQVEELPKGDPEYKVALTAPITEPPDTFIGFFPKNGSALL